MRRAAVLLLLLAACSDGGRTAVPPPPYRSLPPVAVEPCPGLPSPSTEAPRGTALPALVLTCLADGPPVDLRALRGTPTLVNLWASWCSPCRKEMPALQRLYRRANGRVRFLGVNTRDGEREARETIQMTAVGYPSVLDPDERLKDALRAPGLPVTVLVAADGGIAKTLYGEQTEAELLAAIREHLGVAL